ncbi:MAG: transglycosylase SLT domain-containing protein [Nitrospinae bacterium]|nr:transglycosylase SLT domain-containing protein [Nitrospinota bacterium]
MRRFLLTLAVLLFATSAQAGTLDDARRLLKKKDFGGAAQVAKDLDPQQYPGKSSAINFIAGYSLARSGKNEEAKLWLEKAGADSLIGDSALYQLMLILDAQSDYGAMLKTTGGFLDRFPYSPVRQDVILLRAKAFAKTGMMIKAIGMLNDLLARNGDYDKAHWLLAQTQASAGKLDDAIQTYLTIYYEHPQSPFAERARAELNEINKSRKKRLPVETNDQRLKRFGVMVANKMQKEAVEYSAEIKPLQIKPAERAEFYLNLAKAEERLGKADKAIEFYDKSAAVRNGVTKPEALYRTAKIYWNRDDLKNTVETCNRISKEFPKNDYAAQSRYILARIEEGAGHKAEAVALYDKILSLFPSSKVTDDSLWHSGWTSYLSGDYAGAEKSFRRLADKNHNYGGMAPMALYWLVNSLKAQGKEADAFQKTLVTKNPISYYTMLTGDPDTMLKPNLPAAAENGLADSVRAKMETLAELYAKPPALDEKNRWLFESAKAWLAVGFEDTARSLLENLSAGQNGMLWLAWQFHKANCLSCSSRLLDQIRLEDVPSDQSPFVMFMMFPVANWETLVKESNAAGIDPFLALSIIRQESRYDAEAVSSANAYGLMQLILPTAELTAQKLGMRGITTENLKTPEINIKLGVNYLAGLIKGEKGAVPLALGVYNAGPRFMEKIKKRFSTDNMEIFVEQVPYQETKDYIKKVLRNYFIYRKTYSSFGAPTPGAN